MLEVKNVCKKYGKVEILRDVNFTLTPSECICIVGSNGSGKSTLLSIIAGAIDPDKGNIINTEHNRIGYVPQDNILFEELTVMDNLKFWYTAYGLDKKLIFADDSIESMLDLKGFSLKKVNILSGGMKKRVSLAISLCHHPNYLVLDEPCNSLDIIYRNEIIDYLKFLKSMGIGIIISTHSSSEIEALCDKLLVLKSGCASLYEEPKQLFQNNTANIEHLLVELIKK